MSLSPSSGNARRNNSNNNNTRSQPVSTSAPSPNRNNTTPQQMLQEAITARNEAMTLMARTSVITGNDEALVSREDVSAGHDESLLSSHSQVRPQRMAFINAKQCIYTQGHLISSNKMLRRGRSHLQSFVLLGVIGSLETNFILYIIVLFQRTTTCGTYRLP